MTKNYYRRFSFLLIIAIGSSFLFSSPVKAQTNLVTEDQLARANLNLLRVQIDDRPNNDKAKISQLTLLATVRRNLLLRAMREAPELARGYVLNKPIRNGFPPSVRPLIEEEKTLSGEVEVIYAENFSTGLIEWRHFIDTSDYGVVELFFDGEADYLTPSTVVSANTYLLGNSALLALPAATDDKAGDPMARRKSPSPLLGQKKLAVILFKFIEQKYQSFEDKVGSVDEIRKSTFLNQESLAAYYKETSFGKFTVTGDVFGPYLFSDVSSEDMKCADRMVNNPKKLVKTFQKLGQGVVGSIAKDDPSIKNYDYYLFVTPEVCSLTEGFSMKGVNNMVFVDGPYNWIVATHEFGHLLGLGHADGIFCKKKNKDGTYTGFPIDDGVDYTCQAFDYSDPFSIMGLPRTSKEVKQVNNFHKGQLGWLNRSSTRTITENGVYDITPSNIQPSDTPIYRIPVVTGNYKLDAQTVRSPLFYYLEYRKTAGYFDNFLDNSSATRGISLRLAGDYDSGLFVQNTFMIDVNPEPEAFVGLEKAFIGVGDSFHDAKRKITIEVLSVDQSSARVKVIFNSEEKPKITVPMDTTSPTVEIVSVTPGEPLLTPDKKIMGYLPTKVTARAKDSSGISRFNICVGNDCVSVCGTTTGTGYVSCNKSFHPYNYPNQTLHIVAKAYDRATVPNYGEDSAQYHISFTANTDSTCLNCSGVIVIKEEANKDTPGSKIIVPPAPACHTFNTNLSIGMSGSEVSALQTVLTRVDFPVSVSGNFDETTASAVSSFQLQYKNEILTANGLIYPTGYFGPVTRGKMNSLLKCG